MLACRGLSVRVYCRWQQLELHLRSSGTRLASAAVYLIRRTGDPGGLVGREIADQLGYLLRLPDTADRVGRFRMLEKSLVFLVLHPAALVNVCDDNARIDCINANPLRRKLQGRASRQLIERGFGDTVCKYIRKS